MISIFVSMLDDPKHEEQFTQLFEENYDMLMNIAMGTTEDRGLAEDAVSIAFIKVSIMFSKLIFKEENKPGSLKLYLCESVKNNAINLTKKQNRINEKVELVSDFDFIDRELHYEMLADAKDHETYLEAVKFILTMEPKYKRVLILRFVFNLSIKEIAAELEIPVGTVKSRLNRGTNMLKKYFGVLNN